MRGLDGRTQGGSHSHGRARRRRVVTGGLAAAMALLAAGTQGLADTAPAVAPPGTWSATGATLAATPDTAPGGAPALAAAITAATGTLQLAGAATGTPMAGVHGWIRTTADAGAVAVATLGDGAGHQATSAPLHLDGLWQTFGVTLADPVAGALSLTLSTPASAGWPSGTTVEVAGVSLGDTGRSTLVRNSSTTNYFNLTPFGGTARPFVANGYDYGPSPIGAEIGTPWEDPTTCQRDAQILGGEGVTMVAAGIDSAFGNDAAESPVNLTKCADAFWARGIGFGWLFAIQGVNGDGAGFVQEYEQRLQVAIDLLGDHPATYTWLVGNEMNLNGRDANCFFDTSVPGQPACTDPTGGHYLKQLVDYVHANDSGHPVTTKLAGDGGSNCTGGGAMNSGDVPEMDYWAVDAYPATSFGTYFSCLQTDDSTRPALMSEFGQAHYFCSGLDTAQVSLNGTTVNYACPPGSHEDDADAQTANTGLWQGILANEASPSAPSAEMIGGTEFMYSDLWWYSSGFVFFGGTALSPANHDTIAVQGGNWYPNGWWAAEWAGVAEAQSVQQAELGQPRVITPEVGAIAAMWGATVPTVSNVVLTPLGGGPTAACEIQVSWTSAQPATTVVSWGQELLVMPSSFTPVHDVESDNTQYSSQFSSSSLTTAHSFTIPGTIAGGQGNINPGGTYRISVGGFTASGAGDMSAGTDVLVPSLSCS